MGPKALAVGVLLFSGSSLLSGCALKQNPSIVKGSWPDGRIDAAARPLYMLGPAPSSPLAPVSEAPQPPADPATWAASTPSDEGISAAELNRRQILQPIFFDYDRSGLRPDQQVTLQSNAEWLLQNPSARILIEGHCDERGTREYNLALGSRRASAGRDYLIRQGIPASRIETVSYGEELPEVSGHDPQAWASNRRAEFVVVAAGP